MERPLAPPSEFHMGVDQYVWPPNDHDLSHVGNINCSVNGHPIFCFFHLFSMIGDPSQVTRIDPIAAPKTARLAQLAQGHPGFGHTAQRLRSCPKDLFLPVVQPFFGVPFFLSTL